jgi:hypothetical protein
MRTEHAFLAKHPHVPRLLYKYREFKPSHLDALKRGVLYMSSPDRFNDPFDTTVFFDPARFIVEDLSLPEFIEHVKEIERDLHSGTPWRPKVIKNPVRAHDWLRRVINDNINDNSPAEARDALIAVAEGWLKKQYEEMRRRIWERVRGGFSVLSLSANPVSILMWSHYSNSHQGFCIEYNFGDLPPDNPRQRFCFPVLYRRKMMDATRYMKTDATDFNNLFGQYLCLLKSADWAYEKEWRIVFMSGPALANRELLMPKPSAINLGSAAKPDDAKIMEEFCNANGIELKRAVQSVSALEVIIRSLD